MNDFDLTCLGWYNRLAQRSPAFDHAILVLSNITFLKGGVLVTIFCALWFARNTNRCRDYTRRVILATIAGATGAVVVARLLAFTLPFRTRPLYEPALGFRLPAGLDPARIALLDWSAFPSDHAAFFAGLATGLFLISRRLGLLATLYGLLFVAGPRLYLGYHYPSDILGGALIGVAGVAGLHAVVTRSPLTRRPFDMLLRWEQVAASSFYAVFFITVFEVAEFYDSFKVLLSPALHWAKLLLTR